jgi:transposase
VIKLASERDPEILRQVAQLQEREIERLRKELRATMTELARLRGQPESELQRQLLVVEEKLVQQRQALFGRSSEKRGEDGPASGLAERAAAAQRGHGHREQPALLVVDKEHALDEADRMCPSCGGALAEMQGQFEESEEIDVVQRQFVVVKHKRKKYRCACGGCVETALGPTKLRPGNRYSVDFAIEVAAAKYLDHLPLERQVSIMRREGLKVDSQTLWDQIEALARPLRELPERLLKSLLASSCVGMDETTWGLLDGKGKNWYVWTVSGTRGVVHRIDETRSHKVALSLLGSYAGTVMTDGFAGYATARRAGRFRLAHCWAHVRRKFIEAELSYPREAGAVVALIDELFVIEKLAATGPPEDSERLAHLMRLRAERSRPVLRALLAWGLELGRTALPESSLGKAAAYMCKLWPGLVRFRDDPSIPLSNNAAERALRGVVVGRKNHYGSKSRRGTEVAALFYSLFESAKLCGIEPKAYLRAAAITALEGGDPSLPHEFAVEEKARLPALNENAESAPSVPNSTPIAQAAS